MKAPREITLPYSGWHPRHYQEKAWHYLEDGGLRAALIWHRRAGKDDVALHWTMCASQERVGNYWHMLPQASQARRAMWEALNPHTNRRRIDEVFPHELRANTRETDMFIRFKNGSTWQLLGSDNFDSLVGSSPVGLVFSEWPLCDPRAWPMLRPILLENGGWSIFPFTPRGKNHGWSIHETSRLESEWHHSVLTVDDTGIFSARDLASELRELKRENGEEDGQAYFDQEYYVSFEAAVLGAYYARIVENLRKNGQICSVPYEPSSLVDTAWDIGVKDSTAIWFIQHVGRELRVLDYYESSGVDIAHYASILRSRPYAYGDCILPWDARSTELGTGKSIEQMLQGFGFKTRIADNIKVETGIQAVRMMLPKMYFDEKKCYDRGVQALMEYRAEYDEERKTLSKHPLHNWASHAADAMRYFCVGWKDKAGLQLPKVRRNLNQ